MKRATALVALLCAVLIGVYAVYRSENLTPRQSDLEKYPELTPFLAGMSDFRGIRFNIDSNYYSFAFQTIYRSPESYFHAIHTEAGQKGWQLAHSEPTSRTYQRNKPKPIGPLNTERVSLRYDPAQNEVILVREDR